MKFKLFASAWLACIAGSITGWADVKLPALIGDHMLLQRDAPVRIFGMAAPGEGVTVAFRGQSAQTTTDALGRWEKPFLCVFGKNDPVLGRADKPLIAHVPGARGQPHDRIWGGHFVQEDRGPELAQRLVDFIRRG